MTGSQYTNIYNSPVYSTGNAADSSAITYPVKSERSTANLVAPVYTYDCRCNKFVLATPIYGPTIAALGLLAQSLDDCGCDAEYVRSMISPVGFKYYNSTRLTHEPESEFDRDFDGPENAHIIKTKSGEVYVRYNNTDAGTYGGSGSIHVIAERDGSVIKNKIYDINYRHIA